MTVTTDLTFQSPFVLFTISVGPGMRNPIVETVISWTPAYQLRPIEAVSPPGGVINASLGTVTWSNIEIPANDSTDFVVKMCRRGMVTPLVLGTARDMETGEQYPQKQKQVPGGFATCSITLSKGSWVRKVKGAKKIKRTGKSRKARAGKKA